MIQRALILAVVVFGLVLAHPTRADEPKQAAPTAAQLKQAKARVIDTYGPIPSNTDKLVEVTELILADAQNATDHVVRFAMLDTAFDQAVELKRIRMAIGVLDQMSEQYDVDLFDRRHDMLKTIGMRTSDEDQRRIAIDHAVAASEERLAKEAYLQSKRLLQLASTLAKKQGDRELISAIRTIEKRSSSIEREYKAYLRALDALKQDRDNATAKKVAGEYLCYVKGQWSEGLVMLSASGDPALVAIAEQELTLAQTPDALKKLGDGWWDIAEATPGWKQGRIRMHAAELYRQALPGIESVLDKRSIEKRIELAGDLGDLSSLAQKSKGPKWVVFSASKQSLEKAKAELVGGEPEDLQYKEGVLTLNKASLAFTAARVDDFVLSARVSKINGQNLSMTFSAEQNFSFWFNGGSSFGLWTTNEKDLGHFRSPEPHNGVFEMRMVVVGNQIRCYAGGKLIGKREHKQLDAAGVVAISTFRGKSNFRDVRLLPLDDHPDVAKQILEGDWSGVPGMEKPD